MSEPFWKTKMLAEMTREEWESLCDGCAKCCLLKLEDADTGELFHTDVACHLLDDERCRCTKYSQRSVLVPSCITLTPQNVQELSWMPSTCAYRLVAEGRDLPWWHHLVSGSRATVHQAGASVRGRVMREHEVPEDELEDRIVDWPR